MAILLLGTLLVVVLAGIALALVLKRWADERAAREDRIVLSPFETLEYVVPPGQDPALVLEALETAGYPVAPDPAAGSRLIHIECRFGRDHERARVREVIESSAVATIDDGTTPIPQLVRFVDEPVIEEPGQA